MRHNVRAHRGGVAVALGVAQHPAAASGAQASRGAFSLCNNLVRRSRRSSRAWRRLCRGGARSAGADLMKHTSSGAEVKGALRACRSAFLGIGLFSAVINVLMLAGSIYMLQLYDRVLASRSISTLVGLSLILLAAYLLQGSLDSIRTRMLARVGARFDE